MHTNQTHDTIIGMLDMPGIGKDRKSYCHVAVLRVMVDTDQGCTQ